MQRIIAAVVLFAAMPSVQLASASPNIAVVNVATVSEKYQKTSDLEAQFDALRKRLGQERDAMKDKLDRANRSLQEELKPGTEEYRLRKKEIAMLEAELQWFIDNEGQKVEKGLAESLRSIFDDIQSAVREVAEEQGVEIVLAADKLPGDSPDSPAQARQMILLQKVLYWKPEVDLTDAVIARLNKNYKPTAGAAPAAAENPKRPAEAAPKKP
ncbi:MAG: OmpH family outer membrane protein [Planctomycetota bacterium]